MKTLSPSLFLMAICLFMMSGCTITNNLKHHHPAVAFVAQEGDGNVDFGVDIGNSDLSFTGNISYAISEKVLIQGGLASYSSAFMPQIVVSPVDNNYERDKLKGNSVTLGLGLYDKMGRSENAHFEAILTFRQAFNTMELEYDFLGERSINYSPSSFGIQVAFGSNKNHIGIAGGVKLSYTVYGKTIPFSSDLFLGQSYFENYYPVDEILFTQPFFNLRAGKGPVKFNFQISVSIVPFQFDETFEPLPNFAFGINYVFGKTFNEYVKKKGQNSPKPRYKEL